MIAEALENVNRVYRGFQLSAMSALVVVVWEIFRNVCIISASLSRITELLSIGGETCQTYM